jgi:peptidoglycan/LPS O-acetylase OafA/YrhL
MTTEPTVRERKPAEPAGGPPSPTNLDDLQRRVHRAFLIAIGVSAGFAALHGFAESEPPPHQTTTIAAVLLGLGCVVLRRLSTSPMIEARPEFWLGAAGLACGAALALLGTFTAWAHDAPRIGLAYAGAAFILCARPPIPAHQRVRRRSIPD